LRLDGLSLTNDPQTKGGKPITNRLSSSTQPQPAQHLRTMADISIRINNRCNQLIAETGLPYATCYLQAAGEINSESVSAPVVNRGTPAAPDDRAVWNRACEIAGNKKPTPSQVSQAQRELAPLSSEKPHIANRGTPAGSSGPDVAAIASRASQIQAATPSISLAAAYRMAQAEAASSPSGGTLRNRAASTPERIKALAQMVFEAAHGSSNFNTGWEKTLRDHPALFAELGFEVPEPEASNQ
jgi:hypothetical protein